MRRFSGVIVLAAIAVVGWQIGGILSHDALSLMLGVIFGIMAGIPAALVALSSNRTVRHEHVHRADPAEPQGERLLLPAPVPAPRPKITIVQPERVLLSVGNQKRIEVKK